MRSPRRFRLWPRYNEGTARIPLGEGVMFTDGSIAYRSSDKYGWSATGYAQDMEIFKVNEWVGTRSDLEWLDGAHS